MAEVETPRFASSLQACCAKTISRLLDRLYRALYLWRTACTLNISAALLALQPEQLACAGVLGGTREVDQLESLTLDSELLKTLASLYFATAVSSSAVHALESVVCCGEIIYSHFHQ